MFGQADDSDKEEEEVVEGWVRIQQQTFTNWVNDKLKTLDIEIENVKVFNNPVVCDLGTCHAPTLCYWIYTLYHGLCLSLTNKLIRGYEIMSNVHFIL